MPTSAVKDVVPNSVPVPASLGKASVAAPPAAGGAASSRAGSVRERRQRRHLEVAVGVALPQRGLLELADRGLRHRVDVGPALGELPAGNPLAEEGAQLVRARRG